MILTFYSLGKKIKVCGAIGRAAAEQLQGQDQGEPGKDRAQQEAAYPFGNTV
jgi:hypothetical protein